MATAAIATRRQTKIPMRTSNRSSALREGSSMGRKSRKKSPWGLGSVTKQCSV
ncbi:unnamed protein product [Brassica oleracea]